MASPTPPAFREGDNVYVFYRMGKWSTPDRRYMATLDRRHGCCRPRTGLSDGWVPACVVEDHDPKLRGGRVSVKHRWPYFFTERGQMENEMGGNHFEYDLRHVSAAPDPAATVPKLIMPSSTPELAIITFRWGGFNKVVAPAQWGETGSSVSDLFIDSFLDSAAVRYLGNNFEVWTVYIEDHSDMVKIGNAAHLIFGPDHPARRAKHTCAMYHLYPTGFEENCIPNRETGDDGGAALVDQKSLFTMIKAIERVGIPTRFPHPSGFYELLTSKRWTAMMSLVPHLRVPPTVGLPRMLVEQNCAAAAKHALTALNDVKKKQAELRNEPNPTTTITKGVAKLGFSWEALDVKFWEKQKGLEEALFQLTHIIEISQELTGQPHDLESIMVQEYCEHDLEMRLYVVDGKVETIVYTKFCRIKENREFGDFKELFSLREAARQWMGGDVAALENGEKQCREITNHWLAWVEAQTCETPAAIRFDYFVGRSGQAGQATVWTLEICELGFSMLGAKELPDKVFAAMLRSMTGAKEMKVVMEPEEQTRPCVSSPKDSPAAPQQTTTTPPKVLFVNVPRDQHRTKDQQKCTGQYLAVPDVQPNGHPLWVNARGDRWLYHGNDGYWYVGDEEEQELNFECDQGYIRHVASGKTLPNDLAGAWEYGPDWVADAKIVVELGKST